MLNWFRRNVIGISRSDFEFVPVFIQNQAPKAEEVERYVRIMRIYGERE